MITYSEKHVFFIAYVSYVISRVLVRIPTSQTSYYLQVVLQGMSVLVLAFLMLNAVIRFKYLRVKKKKVFPVLILIIIICISLMTKDFLLLSIILLGINSVNLSDDDMIKLFKISFYTIGTITIGILVLCAAGFIENVSTARSWGGEPRYAWGFVHSQIIPLTFFYLIGDKITYQKKVSVVSMIMVLIISLLLSWEFDSRNAFYSMVMLVVLVLFWKIERLLRHNSNLLFENIYQGISQYLAGVMSLLSVGLVFLYQRGVGIAIMIDRVLSSRLRAASMRFSSLPMQLLSLSSYAEYQETLVSVLDNGYLYIISRYGLLYLFLFVVIAFYIACFFRRTKNIQGTIFFICALVSCYITNEIVSLNFLPFWIIGIREAIVVIHNNGRGTFFVSDKGIVS